MKRFRQIVEALLLSTELDGFENFVYCGLAILAEVSARRSGAEQLPPDRRNLFAR